MLLNTLEQILRIVLIVAAILWLLDDLGILHIH
jgi:hypothetical protein